MNLEEHVLDEMVRSSRWLVRARAALFYVNPTFVTYVGCRRLTSSTSRLVCGAGVRVDAARSLLTWFALCHPTGSLARHPAYDSIFSCSRKAETGGGGLHGAWGGAFGFSERVIDCGFCTQCVSDVLDLTYARCGVTEMDKQVEEAIENFLQSLAPDNVGPEMSRGTLVLAFFEQRKRYYFGVAKSTENVYWEQWSIPIIVNHRPRLGSDTEVAGA